MYVEYQRLFSSALTLSAMTREKPKVGLPHTGHFSLAVSSPESAWVQ